jgi:[ribosomal protein S18]-alanine N-acetyltransferase
MFVVRPMRTQDITPMMVVNERCFSNPWSAWTVKIDIERNPNSTWLLLEEIPGERAPRLGKLLGWLNPHPSNVIMGFVAFWIIRGESHITSIAIDPNYRGCGWGEVLLTSVLWRSIEWGAQFSSLEVRVSNHGAIHLYQKYNYQIMGRRASYYHDNNEDAYIMSTSPFNAIYHAMLRARVEQLARRLDWQDTSR